jgi:hypothetical protein
LRPGLLASGQLLPLPSQPDPAQPPVHPEGEGGRFFKIEDNTLVWTARSPDGTQPAVYKMYRNRGPISWQREKAGRFRVQREYDACAYLEQKGLATTPPLGWFFGTHADHGRYEVLCMTELHGSEALTDLVKAGRSEEINFLELFRLLRLMHQVGFYHGRLDLRNLMGMPEPDGSWRYLIMDTPQAMTFKRDLFGTRMAWHDLRQISNYTYDILGEATCITLLQAYGLSEDQARDMVQKVKVGNVSKGLRNLMRFMFGLRARL